MKNNECTEIESRLSQLKLVPVVSVPSVDTGLRLAEILIRCGLPVAEVTFRTSCAAEVIKAMKKEFSELLVLAGTVLSTEQADIAQGAGAECIVIPGFQKEIVAHCQLREIMVCPGTATPTEVLQCMTMGIETVKFFPAEVAGGVGMLKAMEAVFSDVRFMPTGGINPGNMKDYLRLNNVFCCGGSWLAPEAMMVEGNWTEIERRIVAAVSDLQR
ncbi:bifunctional 4-hydroxy-2-oxoglutarate aldolase/2-dehydro-3-deoxy-phosphogluconate aldolase [Desulforhopalus sp. IMCC35007]|uniref:bifunctional 4-hydroxy-2-oxoglutarate aldolase/2-dehydro-3-deoxy-phosphogluconate aldolase n=1 Tax=Desulforhopalus sp. IMCC35007 TaxID=2569543 RepID=UPI0010AE5663|nr:bifunctional 4-hydroxy-2-oxoglutarate aldolase/2-dehydro-3-deoxy-phosphogluconate aldolase [Desulforhopalus sp. IMCC35007]TKB06904.1 bifunctional 4-hydroxy-2-oxoglutarate aldolase/2-dehydro-3-deoxy-phosphogluconate aldolase [Desulforhopalus sp. IMCC35007]